MPEIQDDVRDLDEVIAEEPNTGEDAPKEGADYGVNNEELPERLQFALLALARKFAAQDRAARRDEVRDAWLQREYWSSNQHIYWSDNKSGYMAISGTNGGGLNALPEDVDIPKSMQVFNIYQPYMRSLISALTQNPPGVRFEPASPTSQPDITAAQAAERFKIVIERNNDMKKLQADVARLFCTDGRVAIHTRYVKDGQRFGFVNEPHVDESPEGIQTDKGDREAKGQEVFSVYGVLEVKIPLLLKDFSHFPYLFLSEEEDITMAKAMFPNIADSIQEGAASFSDSEYERFAPLGVIQGRGFSSDAYNHIATIHRVWLRPCAFTEAAEDVREELEDLFPDGAYVCFIGDKYAESRNESMDDHWKVQLAMPADGQRSVSLGKTLIPIQDVFNDLENLRIDFYNQCAPITWYDSELVDIDAISEQANLPGNRQAIKKREGQALEESFYTEQPVTIPADLVQAIQDLRGELAQFITGALPSLFGGQMEGNDTASGYAMARDQAMGQMGLAWSAMQTLWAGIMEQAVRCAAYNRAQGNIEIPGSGKGRTKQDPTIISLEDLKGDTLCFPEKDSSFPDTWSARRNVFMSLLNMMGANPAMAQMMTQPDNLAMGKDLLGLENLVIDGEESRNKQLREISQLLKEVPTPNEQALHTAALDMTVAKVAGQPAPPPPNPEDILVPSVAIDPIFDEHQYEFAEVQHWLNSKEGADARLTNPQGWLNVRLHGLAHYQQIQAAAAKNAPQPKPPAESISFKDLPPEGQQQMAKQAGIDLAPPPPPVPPTSAAQAAPAG